MNCEKCGQLTTTLKYYKEKSGWCPSCFFEGESKGESAMIATDDIPGGLEVKHGICHEDGSPRKFYSKSEIKRAAYEAGWTILGDTPRPNQRLVEAQKARDEA